MRLLLCIALAFVAADCGTRSATDGLPTLNVTTAIGTPRAFDLSEIAADITFIPLKSSGPESLVGSFISHLTETKNLWYISEIGMPVKLFDKTGRFVTTRGVIGRGPNEFTSGVTCVTGDWDMDNLYLKGTSTGGNVHVFACDATGNTFAHADSLSPSPPAMMAFHDNSLIMWNRRPFRQPALRPDVRETMLEILSSNLEPAGRIEVTASDRRPAPRVFKARSFMSLHEGFISSNGRSLLVYESLADTVFRYWNKALSPACVVAMGSNTPPDGAFGESPSVPWSRNFHIVASMMEGDRFMIVRTTSFDGDVPPGEIKIVNSHLVFDKHNPSEGFRPTGPDGSHEIFLDGIAFTPCYVRDNRLVGYMQAFDITDNAEKLTRPDFRAFATTLQGRQQSSYCGCEVERIKNK